MNRLAPLQDQVQRAIAGGATVLTGGTREGNFFTSTVLADVKPGNDAYYEEFFGPAELHGADVSRQGVQRDLLPLVEGTTVNTKYGMVKTDHILFIASGAFHLSKPSDLIPEMQGRFPIRVELESLTVDDFERILKTTDASLTEQYTALLATDGCALEFTEDGIHRMAEIAFAVNEKTENIGARRLYTVMEKLVEEVAFSAGSGVTASDNRVRIDAKYVDDRLGDLARNEDLARYVL